MGIPHLITYLRPYAALEPLRDQNIVIDGPGFCYHIYNICLNERPLARSPFEAAPSYSELGETALEWLNALDQSGAIIKKICFDGFLPPSKFEVRLDRLSTYTRKAIDYHKIHGDVHYRTIAIPELPRPLFERHPTVPSFTKLPAPPFLVPAILETLLQSNRYAGLTEVVPGEADLYCAKFLKEHGGIVLTGDSDLLIHDLGIDGAAAFFREIESQPDGRYQALYGQIYRPFVIAERLSLARPNGLQSLAFQIVMDPQASFANLVKDAANSKAIKLHKDKFQAFMGEYLPLEVISDKSQNQGLPSTLVMNMNPTRAILKGLDPRISEYVLQSPYFAEMAGRIPSGDAQESKGIHVFLPFLLDYPSRTNAWESSTAIRQLAYGLVNLSPAPQRPFVQTVFEHRRQQKGPNGKELQTPALSEIEAACIAICELIETMSKRSDAPPENDVWTALAVYHEIEWALSYGKESLSESLAKSAKTGLGRHKLPWDALHLLALLQGSYYSFRMLFQISSLVLAYIGPEASPDYLRNLVDQLKKLPRIKQYPEIAQLQQTILNLDARNYVKASQAILGISSSSNKDLSKSEKKKRKREQCEAKPAKSRARSNNPFDMLDDGQL